ncbi:MmgE/PrpD family protein [Microbacterium sp. No. 7]|uniref:MmgE/PrpD family protein n=1 Tax=Microbacterium sp. No. 7 TaxID=1714373 RepID=UPI0006CFB920|nr:MmgE/PrpD family protein [Microbacterium sp. No. 7]ALJ19234.1 2-methylcitrate dehydratase [Microbacterium sp. No. 7]
MPTIVDQLAEFAASAAYDTLPADVVSESKRILLDSIGCAVASLGDEGARRGVAYARTLGGAAGDATILGTGERTSVPAAAFANAELINALDQDAVLPPGHVTPYVLPGALAAAEGVRANGRRLLESIAVAHEISFRIGKATDYLRDIVDGVVTIPAVLGYSSTQFGAAAAVGVIRGFSADTLADALGIVGSTAPVNSQRAWMMHAPATTIKYQLAGGLALNAVTAASLAELGHTGDREILDDREYGFPRFIGTRRWEPAPITDALGEAWTFTPFQSFKPYPHCRVMHAIFDRLIGIVEENDLRPDEIESIEAWGESFVQQPVWVNEHIRNPRDAQFSMTHGLAMAASRIPVGPAWQAPAAVHDPGVLALMERSTFSPHPDHAAALAKDPAARTSRVAVRARGQVWTADSNYPKGSPSPEEWSYMTDDELAAKFRRNVEGVVSDADAEAIIEAVRHLEDLDDAVALTALVRPTATD